MNRKQQIICEAVQAIESDFILDQIAKLIYNITNAKQNGHSADEKAAEIIKKVDAPTD